MKSSSKHFLPSSIKRLLRLLNLQTREPSGDRNPSERSSLLDPGTRGCTAFIHTLSPLLSLLLSHYNPPFNTVPYRKGSYFFHQKIFQCMTGRSAGSDCCGWRGGSGQSKDIILIIILLNADTSHLSFYLYAIKTQLKARNAPSRGFWVP